ncbi:hypothetical protein [Streptomyces cyaneofuscatus]|uniref:hypothetical protein n=1 Tax=Streptomyces cyaneofuscatus TaxID=66883 RepID=UPI003646B049
MQKTALVSYAHLPRTHHDRHVLTSTVDVFGVAHWLLADRAPQPGVDVLPFDALVVSVHPGGDVELTELSALRARWPHLDRLPDGGFVVAASRARRYEDADQVQIFDAPGRETLGRCRFERATDNPTRPVPFGAPWEGLGQWTLEEDRFDHVGVSAHYAGGFSRPPALGAVTVHGRTGPQIEFAGIQLIGRAVSAVDTALTQHVEEQDLGLVIGCGGDLGVDGLNMFVRAGRAGDVLVSEARFCQEQGEDHG